MKPSFSENSYHAATSEVFEATSLAVSGMMIPPLVFSSDSSHFAKTRSCNGLIGMFFLLLLGLAAPGRGDADDRAEGGQDKTVHLDPSVKELHSQKNYG
jgi:hypothetical protein